MNNTLASIVTAFIVIILAITLTNPTGLYMPEPAVMTLTVLFFLAFVVLALFVLKEQVHDEREELLRMKASRTAFIAGSLVLVLGIGVQGLQHAVDPWLLGALIVMILAKLITRLWN